MTSLTVQGPVDLRLDAAVPIAGYKHLPPIFFGALLASGGMATLEGVPEIEDVRVLCELLTHHGAVVERAGEICRVTPGRTDNWEMPLSLTQRIRGALYLIPGVLAQTGRVAFGGSGGCQLCAPGAPEGRPTRHLYRLLEAFGATVRHTDDGLLAESEQLHGAEIDILDYSDHPEHPTGARVSSATKFAMLLGMAAAGETRIHNPLLLPYTTLELADFARQLGFEVTSSPQLLCIRRRSRPGAVHRRLLPDISVLTTWLACSLWMQVPMRFSGLQRAAVEACLYEELAAFTQMGATLDWCDEELSILPAEQLQPIDLSITNYGMLTDHQPFFALLLTRAAGPGFIQDQVFPHRFQYAESLRLLGARMSAEGGGLRVTPGPLTRAARVGASDTRAAAALVLASLRTPGTTIIDNIEHLSRGYPDLLQKLQSWGVRMVVDG